MPEQEVVVEQEEQPGKYNRELAIARIRKAGLIINRDEYDGHVTHITIPKKVNVDIKTWGAIDYLKLPWVKEER